SETLELDLSTVQPSIAGPKRPQDRVALADAKDSFYSSLKSYIVEPEKELDGYDETVAETFPSSDPPSPDSEPDDTPQPTDHVRSDTIIMPPRGLKRVPITFSNGERAEIGHGAVVIAAITSCTNTSNPAVMIAAGLLARNAIKAGLSRKPW